MSEPYRKCVPPRLSEPLKENVPPSTSEPRQERAPIPMSSLERATQDEYTGRALSMTATGEN
jgi:hypothetical protein